MICLLESSVQKVKVLSFYVVTAMSHDVMSHDVIRCDYIFLCCMTKHITELVYIIYLLL